MSLFMRSITCLNLEDFSNNKPIDGQIRLKERGIEKQTLPSHNARDCQEIEESCADWTGVPFS